MNHIHLIPQNAVDRLLAGDAEILFAAFGHGLDVNVRWPHWHYPLLHGLVHACPKRVDEMVAAALERGADVDEEFQGMTPVLLAISGWRPEHDRDHQQRRTQCLAKLVSNSQGLDPLLMGAAAAIGYVDAIGVLAEAGCGVETRDEHGATPLHNAYKHQSREAARLLLSLGADIQALDVSGLTPRQLLLAQGNANNAAWQARVQEFDMSVLTPSAAFTRRPDLRL